MFSLKTENEENHNVTKFIRLNSQLKLSEFSQTLIESKEFSQQSRELLPESIFDLSQPSKYPILMSQKFL